MGMLYLLGGGALRVWALGLRVLWEPKGGGTCGLFSFVLSFFKLSGGKGRAGACNCSEIHSFNSGIRGSQSFSWPRGVQSF